MALAVWMEPLRRTRVFIPWLSRMLRLAMQREGSQMDYKQGINTSLQAESGITPVVFARSGRPVLP
jgi:hypothetical protein